MIVLLFSAKILMHLLPSLPNWKIFGPAYSRLNKDSAPHATRGNDWSEKLTQCAGE